MKKNLKKSAIALSIILILILLILCIGRVIADSNTNSITITGVTKTGENSYQQGTTYTLTTDENGNLTVKEENYTGGYNINRTHTTNIKITLDNSPRDNVQNNLFGLNPNIYCVEHGKTIDTWPTYSISNKYNVTDPLLAYILSMPDEEKNIDYSGEKPEYSIRQDIKQNMIWWYLNNVTSNDKETILGSTKCGDIEMCKRDSDGNPLDEDGNKITSENEARRVPNATLQAEIDKAINYKNTIIENEKIAINNMQINGDYVEFEVTNAYFDSLDIYINNSSTVYAEVSKESDGNLKADANKIEVEKEDKNIKIKIPLNKFVGEKAYVKVQSKLTKCTASYYLLANSSDQRLLISDGHKGVIDGASDEENITINTDVSLQKYIIQVNEDALEETSTGLTNRIDTKTYTNEDNENVKDAISLNNTASNNYKYDNTVKIEAGDTVTYRIWVYNNATVEAKDIVVKDRLPYYYLNSNNTKWEDANNKGLAVLYENESDIVIKNASGETLSYTSSVNTTNGCTELSWNTSLAAGDATYFDVTLTFNKYLNGIIINTAWINETDPENSGKYRTVDRDYVEMKGYAVSLEKFVSKVEDSEGNIKEYYDREGKAQHEYDNKSETDSNEKYNNPVKVSNGDKVTYTIKLKNGGDTAVKITKVTDYLPNGVKYNNNSYIGEIYSTDFEHKESETDNGQTKNEIEFTNPIELQPGESKSFEVEVIVIEQNISQNKLKNVAEITEMKNSKEITVQDTTGNDNKDADYIQLDYKEISITTTYTVKKEWELEGTNIKPVSVKVKLFKVQGDNEIDLGMPRVELSNANNWEHTWSELPTGVNYIAREISESGEIVKGDTKYNDKTETTYIPNTTSNGTTIRNKYKPTPIPTKFTVEKVWDDNNNQNRPTEIKVRLYKITGGELTAIGDIVRLDNSNWSHTWTGLPKYEDDNLIRYTARELKDDNSIVVEGENYNDDYKAYYLNETNKTTITNKMTVQEDEDDLVIAGIVWNDLALDKTGSDYNGEKDAQEKGVSGVKVMLYRVDKGVVATTYTNHNGEYSFANKSLSSNSDLKDYEKFIKGPRKEGTTRWDGTYYSYYVIFEYNGATYTSTKYTSFDSTNSLDSNAREKLYNEEYEGRVEKSRTEFNNNFSTIKNDGAYDLNGVKTTNIEYSTINENKYMPQSINKYNENEMKIQSSTVKIDLSNSTDLEQKLKHINLGLRGRDVFDLELTSDVYSTKVTVNGVTGQYNYNDNKVTVRRADTNNYNYVADTANPQLDVSQYKGEEYDQKVRISDVVEKVYDKNDETTGLKIEVTYKITVKNTSNTEGIATKITNYYDSKYNFKGAHDAQNNVLNVTEGTSGTGYKSVILTTPGTKLSQSDEMEIYVVYELEKAAKTLSAISESEKLATYNMAEITEYKTFATTYEGGANNEATRGLIDKDSAPGSAATEKVRLDSNLIGDISTVDYYFAAQELNKIKYEDDTCATPTLYFVVTGENTRTITGTVFRDSTVVDAETKIKTGNGIYEEGKDGEVGVFGAKVQLIELVDGNPVRYEATTNAEGKFEFKGFLPGNYIIRYYYGNTKETVLLKQSEDKTVNTYSFNGEDYQSTNNSYFSEESGNNLNTTPDFWYAYNELKGISTAKDNLARRGEVSSNVIDTDQDNSNKVIDLLNRARAEDSALSGEELNASLPKGTLIEQTKMFADTESMVLTVEKTELVEEDEKQILKEKDQFSEYVISNMNFGIAEVPVTTIDLQKEIQGFTIIDSTGQNILAKAERDANGNMKVEVGNIITQSLPTEGVNGYSSQIEDEKLQGSRLQITYSIKSNIDTEINYDNKVVDTATITEFVDIIDNNLSYNSSLGDNSKYWVVREGSLEQTSIANIDKYTTIVNATDVALDELNKGKEPITITLEKILSSTNSTLEEIISSTVDVYEYNNTVEITGLSYKNVSQPGDDPNNTIPQRDRIRTGDRYIIIPGKQHDTASAERITIIPPMGNGSMDITYYVIAAISLVILAAGVFGIKKFVVNTKK